MFVDQVEIEVVAGRGGDGCVSFRREKYVPRGGPDGGDGGDGGSVIIVAAQGVDNLSALAHRKQWKAKNGRPGRGSQCHGAAADNLTINVPPGTIVHDLQHDFLMKDLARSGDRLVVARGGRGGKGNLRFKSSTNQTPRQSTPGAEGEARRVRLELKSIADVGLVGKPNAGKSTLLGRLTRARPAVAAYAFTTKSPNLGRVQVDRDRSFLMADIPGLIEGAAAGAGLGHDFLRHIQRAGVLVHLVEPQPLDGSDPLENYRSVQRELERYDPQLAARPQIPVITKADFAGAAEVRDKLANASTVRPLLISAVTGQGLNELIGVLMNTLNEETHGRADVW